MEIIIRNAICNGKQTRISNKSGQPYSYVEFVSGFGGLNLVTTKVFGKDDIPADMTPRDYIIVGSCDGISADSITNLPVQKSQGKEEK